MAASGYMTEVDVESVWKTSLDTARFDKINIVLAELLNFEITGDASINITDTKVTPVIKQIATEVLFELLTSAKLVDAAVPWEFVSGNIASVFNRMIGNYWRTIKKIQDVLYDTLQVEPISGFGSGNTL